MSRAQIWSLDAERPALDPLTEAAQLLQNGGLVAFPTETVYGLGANALDPKAVAGIFRAKGRPSDNPLILHLADAADLARYVARVPHSAQLLAAQYWPGPLTLVLPKSERVPDILTAGLPNVALRVPAHPVARALIRAAGVPLAAPSANTSGRPSPTDAQHVIEDLQDRIDGILDAGPVPIGVESTVLDLSGTVPVLLRPGGVSLESLRNLLGEVHTHRAIRGQEVAVAQAPGMKYRHYAPEGKLTLVEGPPEQVRAWILKVCGEKDNAVERIGVLSTSADFVVPGVEMRWMGADAESIARQLFRLFREFNGLGIQRIYAEGIDEAGMGMAVMNRLRKAAAQIIEL